MLLPLSSATMMGIASTDAPTGTFLPGEGRPMAQPAGDGMQLDPSSSSAYPGWDADSGVTDAQFEAFVAPEPGPVDPSEIEAQHVTAVLVTHNGAHWLPAVVAGLTAQTRRPDTFVVVDTGSVDDSLDLVASLVAPDDVLRRPAATGFGAAVRDGLEHASRTGPPAFPLSRRWVWVLHDDCAPEPEALYRLLEAAQRDQDVAVVGGKAVAWSGPPYLVEVGLSISNAGRRHTGLERFELDQGQHDQAARVLAVGSAGMLVRRDAWDTLGGFDPTLHLFRDDIDFGWRANVAGYRVLVCPLAVFRHAEAAAHGRRRLGVSAERPHLLDRRHAQYVLLANAAPATLPSRVLAMLLSSALRVAGFLLAKVPSLAWDEVRATTAALAHPIRLHRARVARRETAARGRRTRLRGLFPSRSAQFRHSVDSFLLLLSGQASGHDVRASDQARQRLEEARARPPLVSVLTGPGPIMVVALAFLALVAARALVGPGALFGGALLPAGPAGEVWGGYLASWHQVGLGSAAAAPPWLAVLAVLGLPLFNSAAAATQLLVLGCVPLAGAAAWLATRGVGLHPWLRLWACSSWALLPAGIGAVASGRLGTCLSAVLLPQIARACVTSLGRPTSPGPVRPAWTAGLLLCVVAAFVPALWLLALALAVIAAAAALTVGRQRRWGWASRLARMILPAPIVLSPWLPALVQAPGLVVAEAGVSRPGLSPLSLPVWQVLALHAGGPGSWPWWLGIPLVVAALAAGLVRTATAAAGWGIALSGLVMAVLLSRASIETGEGRLGAVVAAWGGPGVLVAAGGLLIATAAAADAVGVPVLLEQWAVRLRSAGAAMRRWMGQRRAGRADPRHRLRRGRGRGSAGRRERLDWLSARRRLATLLGAVRPGPPGPPATPRPGPAWQLREGAAGAGGAGARVAGAGVARAGVAGAGVANDGVADAGVADAGAADAGAADGWTTGSAGSQPRHEPGLPVPAWARVAGSRQQGLPSHGRRAARFGVSLVVLIAGAVPILAAGWWVGRGADDPLIRANPSAVPAYAGLEASTATRPRTLVLRSVASVEGSGADDPIGDPTVRYALLRETAPRIGDAQAAPDRDGEAALDAVLSDLISGRGAFEVADLAAFGIRYLSLPAPVDPTLASRIGGLSGLSRAGAPKGSQMWRLEQDQVRVRFDAETGQTRPLPSGDVDVDAFLPASSPAGQVVLTDAADPGWRATLNGRELEPAADGWAQTFDVPAGGGRLTITHDDPTRRWMVAGQALAVGVLLVLAFPGGRADTRVVDDVVPDAGDDDAREHGPRDHADRADGARGAVDGAASTAVAPPGEDRGTNSRAT